MKKMKNEFSYVSIHGPVVILKLAEVMLRWALYLVDLQQQLVVFWFVGSWKNESGWWPNNKTESNLLRERKIKMQWNKGAKEPWEADKHREWQVNRKTDWLTNTQKETLKRHFKLLHFSSTTPDTLLQEKKWHLPFSYRRCLSLVNNFSNRGSVVVYYDMFTWRKYHICTKEPSSSSPEEKLSWPGLWHVKMRSHWQPLSVVNSTRW